MASGPSQTDGSNARALSKAGEPTAALAGIPTSAALLADLKRFHPKLIDLSLDRVVRILDALGNPHAKLPKVVHIAGTNGKGSTTAFLSAILQSAGLRVHAYTSPHLVTFHERIALSGPDGKTAPIAEDQLVDVLKRVTDANAGGDLTFFELTTAAAFVAFAETPADVVLLEVGLGGRLDATNVIARPDLTVITPVAMDHADKLGDTIGAIAREKAGIIKPHVPCIVGPQLDDAFLVIQAVAERLQAPLIAYQRDFDAYAQNGRMVFQDSDQLIDLPMPGLRGTHQIENAGTAVAAVRALCARSGGRLAVDERSIALGLVDVAWPGRMMPISSGPLRAAIGCDDELWIDGGHNPAAGQAVARAIADLEDGAPKPTFLIVAMLANKDHRGFLAPFASLVRRLIAVPITSSGETGGGALPDVIAAAARAEGIDADVAETLNAALCAVHAQHPGAKRVLICGSLYLAGEALERQRDGVSV